MNTENYTKIFFAIKNNDIESLKEIFSNNKNVDLNERVTDEVLTYSNKLELNFLDNCKNYTPIHLAVKLESSHEIVELLLKNGADVNKVVSEPNSLFLSTYNYTILNSKKELTTMFNKYIEENNGKSSIRTKKRSENTKTFNFKKASKENVQKLNGKVQKFWFLFEFVILIEYNNFKILKV